MSPVDRELRKTKEIWYGKTRAQWLPPKPKTPSGVSTRRRTALRRSTKAKTDTVISAEENTAPGADVSATTDGSFRTLSEVCHL
jgi:hypothetical protein